MLLTLPVNGWWPFQNTHICSSFFCCFCQSRVHLSQQKKSKVMSYYLNGHWDMIEWSYCKFYLYQVFSNIICWCKLNLICRIVISIAGTTGNGFLVLELLIGSKAVKKVIIISFKHKTYTWIAIQKLCHNKLKWHTRNLWKVLWIPKKLLKWTITR